MGDICIHGNNSQIQRDALVGCKDNEAGLIQLLKFQLKTERGERQIDLTDKTCGNRTVSS